MQTIAYHATLFEHNVGISGIAMRTGAPGERRVFFVDDATQQWRELHDSDASNLHLHGRVDLVFAAAIADGNLVLKASKTVERRAA